MKEHDQPIGYKKINNHHDAIHIMCFIVLTRDRSRLSHHGSALFFSHFLDETVLLHLSSSQRHHHLTA
jgi:hypothetical protein